jgi:hypothetical protein
MPYIYFNFDHVYRIQMNRYDNCAPTKGFKESPGSFIVFWFHYYAEKISYPNTNMLYIKEFMMWFLEIIMHLV